MTTILDLNSGTRVDLKGEDLEMFEEGLQEQVCSEIDNAEDYLDETIRPRIEENWKFYRKELPKKRDGEAGFVDNTCQATVDHYVAHCADAFTSSDTLEVVPYGITNPTTTRVINQVVNAVLDSENDRFNLYQSFFRDAMVSGASVFKPFVKEETKIDKQFFTDASEEEVAIRQMTLEASMKYDRVEKILTSQKEVEITQEMPIDPSTTLGAIAAMDGKPASVTTTSKSVQLSGYFALVSKEKTIKIEPIPAENFLINKDARSIDDARFVGHKAMVTISDLLSLGFPYEKVSDVFKKCGGDNDADNNEASRSRKSNIIGDDNDDTSVDRSQREVELYEVYIKSSMAETLNEEDEIAVSKLYQVFMAEDIILDYQEVDFIPYSGASPTPVPHMFWGTGMVDATKHIQTAKTGLMRQQFAYNELAARPRFIFQPDQLVNPRDIYNTQPGAGIAVKQMGAIQPVQLAALGGDNVGMASMLDSQREVGTGMSFTGQGMLGDVLKAGGSTISAQMVLSEGQMVQKAVIQTILENGIKPLIENIYNLLRENFSSWEVTVDGETFEINPNEWPRLREICVNTPLGKSAKLERAQTHMSLFSTLASAQGEAAKLVTADGLRGLLIEAFEAQEMNDASAFMASSEEIAQKDQLSQQMAQMAQTLQQMQAQMQQMQQQNQVLSVQASAMAQKQLELDERRVAVQEATAQMNAQKTEAAMTQDADEQSRKQEETDATLANMADKQSLAEQEFALKQQLAEEDAQSAGGIDARVTV